MTDALAQQAIDAIHGTFGEHDGRAVHVKGAWARGTFTGTPEGAALCRAPFLTGGPVEALVRFSTGGGNPAAHDGERDGRGIAVKLFIGGDQETTDLLGISVPEFSSRTPEDFVQLVRLGKRDPETGQPDFAKLGPFLEAHPETMAAVQHRLGMPPPASWCELVYNGIHAFRWIGPDGTERWVRTRWLPDTPGDGLDDADAMARDRDYLSAELRERLAAGPAGFMLVARIAADGDPLDDPTQAWPDEGREEVAAGRLELRDAIGSPETPSDIHVFDPTRVCDGIELSDDPILHFRHRAYDVSARGRWTG